MKWYTGLTANEIVKGLEVKANEIVQVFKKIDQVEIAERHAVRLETAFENMFEEVKTAIVDTKTAYYMYNEKVYQEWDLCHANIFKVKNDLDNNILNTYIEKNWI